MLRGNEKDGVVLAVITRRGFDSFKFTLPDSLNHEFFEDSESSKRP